MLIARRPVSERSARRLELDRRCTRGTAPEPRQSGLHFTHPAEDRRARAPGRILLDQDEEAQVRGRETKMTAAARSVSPVPRALRRRGGIAVLPNFDTRRSQTSRE